MTKLPTDDDPEPPRTYSPLLERRPENQSEPEYVTITVPNAR